MTKASSTRDKNGALVVAGTAVRVLSIDSSVLSPLDDKERSRVNSMLGQVLEVYEVDQWGGAWVEQWWQEDNGNATSHSLALRPEEMELVYGKRPPKKQEPRCPA